MSTYDGIQSLIGKRIRADVVGEHWGDVVRLVASIKAGGVAPSTVLKKLSA